MVNSLRKLAAKIRDIDRRYAQPRIEMSRAVRVSLIALRVYLLFLVALMLYKFVSLVL